MSRWCIGVIALGFVLSGVGCSTCAIGNACHSCSPVEKGPKKLFEWAICKKNEAGEDKAKDKDTGADNGDAEKKDETDRPSKGNGTTKQETSKSEESDKGKKAKDQDTAASKQTAPANGKKKGDNGKDSNGKKKGDNGKDEEPEDDEIVTDRPDFTEASTTVGKGRIQLETGYTYVRDRANGSRLAAHSYPEALLRVGLFAEWFEVRVGQNFANERTTMPDGAVESGRGAEDLYLGVKLALTEQQKSLPEMALVLQMTVPTGSRDFSAREVLPGINWLYGWDVVKDCLAVGGSTQANRVRGVVLLPVFDPFGVALEPQEGKHSYLEIAQSVTVNYTLTKKLGAYTEWFAFFPHSALDPDVGPEHYLNGGFTYKFTPNTQFDVRAGFGLNRHADDFFAGTGFSFRY